MTLADIDAIVAVFVVVPAVIVAVVAIVVAVAEVVAMALFAPRIIQQDPQSETWNLGNV